MLNRTNLIFCYFVTMKNFASFLFETVPIDKLAIWRILFGLLMCMETWGAIAVGWVDQVFVVPQVHFHFIGFEFLPVLPGKWQYLLYVLMGFFALGMALGYRYLLSTSLLFVFWWNTYLTHKIGYNNHHYLYGLMLGLFLLVPADKKYSYSRTKWSHVFRWHYLLFLSLFLLAFVYAAVAKIYPDWLQGQPIGTWLTHKRGFPRFFSNPNFHLFVAWGGIAFDALVIPALMFRKTRGMGVAASFVFHLFNSIVFEIGTFPYMMLAALVLFADDKWISRRWFFRPTPQRAGPTYSESRKKGMLMFYLGFVLLQFLLPLRHFAFKDNVFWTEEGHRLSWRMMLRYKSGQGYFLVEHSNGKVIEDHPSKILTYDQYNRVCTKPDMLYSYVQMLKKKYPGAKIFAHVRASVNGRSLQAFVKPNIDLSQVKWQAFGHSDWLKPFGGFTTLE